MVKSPDADISKLLAQILIDIEHENRGNNGFDAKIGRTRVDVGGVCVSEGFGRGTKGTTCFCESLVGFDGCRGKQMFARQMEFLHAGANAQR